MSSELQRTLGRIEANIDELLRRQKNHDSRLATLERRMYYWNGAFAVIIAGWTFLAGPIATALGLK